MTGVVLLTGCESPTPDGPVRVRVAALTAPGTPWHDEWLRFAARLEAERDSGIELDLFLTGQLGSEETALSNLRRNRVQIGGFSLHGLATVVPELSVLLAPYLFDSRDEVDFVLDHYVDEIFRELFAAQGLAMIRWSEVGWNHVFCREPVVTPDDIRGVKIRASNAVGPQEFARSVGADNIPVNFAELVTGLQTGLIDCGQGGIGMYALAGVAAEAPHLTLTQHIFDTGLIIANQRWLDALDTRRREILLGSIEPVEIGRTALRQALEKIRNERLAALGVTVHALGPEQRRSWRQATAGSHARIVAETGGRAAEVFALIEQGKRDFARGAARAPVRQ